MFAYRFAFDSRHPLTCLLRRMGSYISQRRGRLHTLFPCLHYRCGQFIGDCSRISSDILVSSKKGITHSKGLELLVKVGGLRPLNSYPLSSRVFRCLQGSIYLSSPSLGSQLLHRLYLPLCKSDTLRGLTIYVSGHQLSVVSVSEWRLPFIIMNMIVLESQMVYSSFTGFSLLSFMALSSVPRWSFVMSTITS